MTTPIVPTPRRSYTVALSIFDRALERSRIALTTIHATDREAADAGLAEQTADRAWLARALDLEGPDLDGLCVDDWRIVSSAPIRYDVVVWMPLRHWAYDAPADEYVHAYAYRPALAESVCRETVPTLEQGVPSHGLRSQVRDTFTALEVAALETYFSSVFDAIVEATVWDGIVPGAIGGSTLGFLRDAVLEIDIDGVPGVSVAVNLEHRRNIPGDPALSSAAIAGD